jgi:hypothetical protein
VSVFVRDGEREEGRCLRVREREGERDSVSER